MINNSNLIEHKTLKGYFHIPNIEDYVVNKEGNFKYLLDYYKKIIPFKKENRISLFVNIIKNKQNRIISVPRLIASTFLQLPKEANNNFNKVVVAFKDNDPFNVKIENLKWITLYTKQSEIKNKLNEELKLKYPLDYTHGDGFYPNPVESKEYPGYYRIPVEDDYLVINKVGEIIRLNSNKKVKIGRDSHGYAVTNLFYRGYRRPYLVHRFLAMLFLPIPIRHANKSFDDLQVNHKDGNKQNNCLSNLEWVTNQENKDHAYKLGLNKGRDRIPVIARNIKTDEIFNYESILDCCRDNFIDKNMLRKHIFSITAGRIINNDLVFKLNDGKPWPLTLAYSHHETDLWKTVDVVANNVETNQICLFTSLRQACLILNLSHGTLQNIRYRKGNNVPYNGWIFYPLTENVFI